MVTKRKRSCLRRLKRRRFGEVLLAQGSITQEQLDEALGIQEKDGGLIGDIMVNKGFITENEVVRSLSAQYALPVLRIRDYDVDKELVAAYSPEVLYVNLLLPLSRLGDMLLFAAADLPAENIIETLEEGDKHEVVFYIASSTDIMNALARHLQSTEDQITEYVSLRRRKSNRLRREKKTGAPEAVEVEEEQPAEAQELFTELDNAWESIFDEAEQNLKTEK